MRLLYRVLAVLSLGVALYALVGYGLFSLGTLVHPAMRASFQIHAAGVYAHIFGAAVALGIGPWQFSVRLRQRHPQLHRWLGRTYLTLGVVIGGGAGLYIAQYAYGGGVTHLGFGLLAITWLLSGAMAYRAIRSGDTTQHRAWMVRNFALTFAAVTLRVELGLFFAAGVAFETFYPWLAWLCWIPNLMVAEWYLRWTPPRRLPLDTLIS